MTTRSMILACAFALLSLQPALPLRAQAPRVSTPATPVATFVAIPEAFPDIDARALVVREPGRDVLLLHPDDVSTDALFMALAVLARMRVERPVPTQGQMAPITGFVLDSPPSGRELGRLQAVLNRLEGRPASDLGTLGAGRIVALREGQPGR